MCSRKSGGPSRGGSLGNPRAFRTWLFQATRHRAIDFLRARKREQEIVEEAAREIDEAVIPDDLARGLDSGAGAAALADLSPAHREVLLLRYQEDMSYAQIAIVVGSSVGTIRSRLHHAKRRLQEAMSAERASCSRSAGTSTSFERG